MKKKILFAIIALVTLLAFTGCDKILEFMFPDSTGGGDGDWGDKSIQVQIQVFNDVENWWDFDIYAELSESIDGGTPMPVADAIRIGRATVPWEDPTAIPQLIFRYDGLVDAKTYSVRVWMDKNLNFGPDIEDPSTNAHTDMGFTTVIFPFYDADFNPVNQANLFAELQAPPPPVNDATPFVFVKGDLVGNVDSPYIEFFFDTTVDSTRNIDWIQYEIYDPGWNYLTGGTVYGDYLYLNLYGYMGYWGWYDGTYRIRIWDASTNGETTGAWQYDTDFRMVYPYPAYNYFYADVSGYSFDSWPWYLDWTGYYPVHVTYYDGAGFYVSEQEVGISSGSFYSSTYWESYQLYAWDGANAGYAEVVIDKDQDGTYGSVGDLAAQIPFYLDWNMYNYGGYLWPTFDANPGRFLPYSDYAAFYP